MPDIWDDHDRREFESQIEAEARGSAFYARAIQLSIPFGLLSHAELAIKLGKIEALLENPFALGVGGLTAEEARLLKDVVFGGGVKEAIARNGKNANTGRNVLASARRKLGIESSAQAAGMVLRTIASILRG